MTPNVQVQLYATAVGATVGWRLLSGNNRVLGRGGELYSDVSACRRAVAALQHQLPGLQSRVRRIDRQRWNWELHAGAGALVAGGHSFDRAIRCEQGLVAFIVAFDQAPVRPEIVINGSRRFGSVA